MRGFCALTVVLATSLVATACGSDDGGDGPPDDVASPCVAFARASEPKLAARAFDPPIAGKVRTIKSGAGKAYVLDDDGARLRVLPSGSDALATPMKDFAIAKDAGGVVRAFVVRSSLVAPAVVRTFELVRFTSPDGGGTFDVATASILLSIDGRTADEEAVSLSFGAAGLLYVAIGDATGPAEDPASLLGKVLRLDVGGAAYVAPPDNPFTSGGGRPEIWGVGVRKPQGLDVDGETGDVWLLDEAPDGRTLVDRLVRGSREKIEPVLTTDSPAKHPSGGGLLYRGTLARGLAGRYLYPAPNNAVVAVDRFGPSGPPQATAFTSTGDAFGALGRDASGELVAALAAGVAHVVDDARDVGGGPPSSLLATKCFDMDPARQGAALGAISYDVNMALWSDGATKTRQVVVPKGQKVRTRPDGDFTFPVGTVAVKTFIVDGKPIETRLLVQHELESWTGYSYAWKADGTDAELVFGNRVAKLPSGKTWYFPSTADCDACHTPAAGYTLGLEAKQLLGSPLGITALEAIEKRLDAPLDRASVKPLASLTAPGPTAEQRARSYLHANCSVCHREGSATGTSADLDLRIDVPLAQTHLCDEPKAGKLGIADPRVVVPRDPARSVLVARMRALDETRMPKLASRVVDEAGVAAVEAWIREMGSCP